MELKTSKSSESVVREIKYKTRRKFNSEERIRIILEDIKVEDSIATICRCEGDGFFSGCKIVKFY